eukprot:4564373-Pleurochrysis_carterae.AAC.1
MKRKRKKRTSLRFDAFHHVIVDGITETQFSFVHASGRCAVDLMLAVQPADFANLYPGKLARICEKQVCHLTIFTPASGMLFGSEIDAVSNGHLVLR